MGVLPAPVAQFIRRGFQVLMFVIGTVLRFLSRFSGRGLLSALWYLVGFTGLSFLGWLMVQGWRRWQRRLKLSRLAPMEQIYQQMLWILAQQGYGKRASQTPLEYAAGLQQRPDFRQGSLVRQIIDRYICWRYGGQTVDVDGLQTRLQELRRSGR